MSRPVALLILGGKTRLAKALFAAARAAGRETFVVYANPDEQAALARSYPDSALLDASRTLESRRVCIFVCAFGLNHPARPDLERHTGRLHRDADLLLTQVRAYDRDLHVVLVSSVVALAPPRDRSYYAGFKNLAESAVAAQLQHIAGALLTVLYPGRLVERGSRGSALGWLSTSHDALARKMLSVERSASADARIVGLDARLWLMAKAVRMFLLALWPSHGVTQLNSRDGLPRV